MLKHKKGETVVLLTFTGMRIGEFEVVAADKATLTIHTSKGEQSFDRKTGLQLDMPEGKEKYAGKVVDPADAPAPKPKKAPTPKAKPVKEKVSKKEEEEIFEEDDEEEEEPAPKKKAAPKKAEPAPKKASKKAPVVVEEDDEDEDDFEDDDDEFEEI